MAEKKIKTRIQSKHGTEKTWADAPDFKPLAGEIIVYDKDTDIEGGTHAKPRIKVGDGDTVVGELDFIVDKEETDAKIAEVKEKTLGAFNRVTANGTQLIFTAGDDTSITVETQDTNTDQSVFTAKNNTAKAYLTGTTVNKDANIGGLVFDENVYLDTTAGTLVANTFKGTATKAVADEFGNNINDTFETKVSAEYRMNRAHKESWLKWGGRNISGSTLDTSPMDAALVDYIGANRFAFLSPDWVVLEASTDGGTTWSVVPDDDETIRKSLFSTGSIPFYIGNSSETAIDKSAYMARITITVPYPGTWDARLCKFTLDVSTDGSTDCFCSIDARTRADSDAGNDTWTVISDRTGISGGSWNILNTDPIEVPADYQQLRFTFGAGENIDNRYAGLNISLIRAYSTRYEVSSYQSNMATHGHMYSYDENQNVTFPANVSAEFFNGDLDGNASTATRFNDNVNEGGEFEPVHFVNGVPTPCAPIPQIHSGTTVPQDSLGKNGDIYVMPYAHNIPAIYSGTTVPDHTIGVDGDIYIMY